MKDYIMFEDALKDPSLSHFHEVIHFLEANEDKILFLEKFMAGLKGSMRRKIRRILGESPEMPPLKLVITALTGVNEKLPPEMILEITDFIIKEWQNLQQKASEKAPVKMYADLPELSEVAEDEAIKHLLVKPKI